MLLFDPLAAPDEILELAADRSTAIALTAPWHERDTKRLVEKLGAPVYTPPPDMADDLVRKYGLDPAKIPAGWHSSDLEWLLVDGGGDARLFLAGDRLPVGVEAFPGRSHERRAEDRADPRADPDRHRDARIRRRKP